RTRGPVHPGTRKGRRPPDPALRPGLPSAYHAQPPPCAEGRASASTGGWSTPYRAVIGSRIRAQRSYPTSFVLDLFGALLIGLAEFAEVWVIFHNITVLGGLDFNAILLLFGLSNLAFSMADLLVGHVDSLPTFVRMGTIDAFYLRPQPVLAQLVTSELSLRRLARIGVALVALTAGLTQNDIAWGRRSWPCC
ncbi:MAG: ABC-2 family transporter protein, partial [Dermatophilaceae bacterium]